MNGLKGKVFARGAFFRPDRFSFLISPSLLLSATRPSVWVLPGGGVEGEGRGREERTTFCGHVGEGARRERGENHVLVLVPASLQSCRVCVLQG